MLIIVNAIAFAEKANHEMNSSVAPVIDNISYTDGKCNYNLLTKLNYLISKPLFCEVMP